MKIIKITLIIIMILVAVDVEQGHGGSRWLAPTESDSTALEAEIPAESTEGET